MSRSFDQVCQTWRSSWDADGQAGGLRRATFVDLKPPGQGTWQGEWEPKFFFSKEWRPGERVGTNWASFRGIWWVVVLSTWMGGASGSDAGLAGQATPGERNTAFEDSVVFSRGTGGLGFQFRRWRVGGGQNHHAGLNSGHSRAGGRHRAGRGAVRWRVTYAR